MNKIEKYIIAVITLIAVGTIGTAVYFGINKNYTINNNAENNIETNKDNDESLDEEEAKENYSSDISKLPLCTNNGILKNINSVDFNKLVENSNELDLCTIYNIEDLDVQVVVAAKKKYNKASALRLIIDDKEIDFFEDGVYGGFYLTKSDNYILVSVSSLTSGVTDIYVYDKAGNKIDFYDCRPNVDGTDGHSFVYLEVSDKIIGYKIFQTTSEQTVQHGTLVDDISDYCSNEYNTAAVKYKLIYKNGNFYFEKIDVECTNE